MGRAELGGLDVQHQTSCGYLGITKYSEYIALPFSCKRRGFCPSCARHAHGPAVAPLVERVIPWGATGPVMGGAQVRPDSVPLVPLLNAHTLFAAVSHCQLVLAIPSLNQLLAQPPPALPRVPEGCISLIAGLLTSLPARRRVSMVPSSPPAWARAAYSGWLGATARRPTPSRPGSARQQAACLLPAGRTASRRARGLGRCPVASPTPRVHSRRDCGKIAFEIPIRQSVPSDRQLLLKKDRGMSARGQCCFSGTAPGDGSRK